MKITLFSRNTLQNDLFLGVSEELEKSEFQTDILMPGKGESKNNIIFPEVEISDIAGSIIFRYQKDFTRLCRTYENLNIREDMLSILHQFVHVNALVTCQVLAESCHVVGIEHSFLINIEVLKSS